MRWKERSTGFAALHGGASAAPTALRRGVDHGRPMIRLFIQ